MRCITAAAGHTEAVLAVAFSPDGKALASGSGDTTLRLWDLATQTPLRTCKARLLHPSLQHPLHPQCLHRGFYTTTSAIQTLSEHSLSVCRACMHTLHAVCGRLLVGSCYVWHAACRHVPATSHATQRSIVQSDPFLQVTPEWFSW